MVETVTEFGMLGKIGVNGYGVGVMLNMLHHDNDAGRGSREGTIGYPVHLLSRRILDEARTFDDAVARSPRRRPRPRRRSPSSTAPGRRATLELFPGGPGRLDPEDGVLVRTNHFVSPEGRDGCLAAHDQRRPARSGSTSCSTRSPTARPRRRAGPRGDDRPRDRADGVGSICAHPDRSTDPVLWHRTLATVALDVEQVRLDVRADGPCGHRDD